MFGAKPTVEKPTTVNSGTFYFGGGDMSGVFPKPGVAFVVYDQ
jgi:hypothetical protein